MALVECMRGFVDHMQLRALRFQLLPAAIRSPQAETSTFCERPWPLGSVPAHVLSATAGHAQKGTQLRLPGRLAVYKDGCLDESADMLSALLA